MKYSIRNFLLSIPFIGNVLRKVFRYFIQKTDVTFESSAQYWEDRYHLGGTSGSGSYGRLAEFKAQFINEFSDKHNIFTCVEFGCGDGNQPRLVNYKRYIGFDVSKTAIDNCRNIFRDVPNYEFHIVDSGRYNTLTPVELALSLNVIYYLIEDNVFNAYMRKLFSSARRYVVIYSCILTKRILLCMSAGVILLLGSNKMHLNGN